MKKTLSTLIVASALAIAPAAALAQNAPHDHTPVDHGHTPVTHDHSNSAPARKG